MQLRQRHENDSSVSNSNFVENPVPWKSENSSAMSVPQEWVGAQSYHSYLRIANGSLLLNHQVKINKEKKAVKSINKTYKLNLHFPNQPMKIIQESPHHTRFPQLIKFLTFSLERNQLTVMPSKHRRQYTNLFD